MEYTIGKNANKSDNLMEFLKPKSQGANNTKCFEVFDSVYFIWGSKAKI
jgi:hypothetical protein